MHVLFWKRTPLGVIRWIRVEHDACREQAGSGRFSRRTKIGDCGYSFSKALCLTPSTISAIMSTDSAVEKPFQGRLPESGQKGLYPRLTVLPVIVKIREKEILERWQKNRKSSEKRKVTLPS